MKRNLVWIYLSVMFVSLFSLTPFAQADVKIVIKANVDMDMSKLKEAATRVEAKNNLDSMKPLLERTLYISGNKVREDTAGGPIIMIVNKDNVIETDLDPKNKQYMKTKYSNADVPPGSECIIKDTGKTKAILGHKCHLVTFVLKKPIIYKSGSAWLSDDVSEYNRFSATRNDLALIIPLKGIKGLPMSMTMIAEGASGKLFVTTNVTSISNSPLPASTFEIPAGYSETK
jgi:hypothetical protein